MDETIAALGKIREEAAEDERMRVICDVRVEKDDGTRVLLGDDSALRARSEP